MFTEEIIDKIFENVDDDCFVVNESFFLEFKKSFTIANINEYIKIFAGLANHRGGYIIFGVEPNEKRLVGLEQKSINMFDKIDTEQFRKSFENRAQPLINYEQILYVRDEKKFIVFSVEECKNKPVVMIVNDGKNFSSGDIFFRYNDSIKKILYNELNEIIEEKRLQEQMKWMNLFGKISTVGLDSLVLINSEKGELLNPTDNSIIIDQSLIKNLNYIKEGTFNEKEGKPAIKLIGKIIAKNDSEDEMPKAILAKDIFCKMLEQDKDIDPLEFIKQSCDIQGKFPIHYYAKISGKKIEEVKDYINRVKTSKQKNKEKIIERLKGMQSEKGLTINPEGRLCKVTDAMKTNRKLKERLLKNGVGDYGKEK